MSKVTVSGVSKVYPGSNPGDSVLALSNVGFTVHDNEFCSLLGHSGCGKTTLLNMIAGFEQATEGKLLLDDKPIGKPSWEKAVIFQDYALFPWMTVVENIEFGLEMKKVPREARLKSVREHVRLVGLAGFEDRYPHPTRQLMRVPVLW